MRFAIIAVLALASCAAQSTPLTKYGTALDAYIAQEQALVDIQQAGQVDINTYHTALLAIHAERQALKDWKAAIDAGQDPSAATIALGVARASAQAFIDAHPIKKGTP